jgi:hypothetical protein
MNTTWIAVLARWYASRARRAVQDGTHRPGHALHLTFR